MWYFTPAIAAFTLSLCFSCCLCLFPCVPLTGKTALVIGQDFESIRNYSTVMHRKPYGVMSYASLLNSTITGDIAGLWDPVDYGSGLEWAKGSIFLSDHVPVLQLGLNIVDLCEKIIDGKLDKEIKELAQFLRSNSTWMVYVRIGYEFDNIQNHYEPFHYKAAFGYIVDLFRIHSASKISTNANFSVVAKTDSTPKESTDGHEIVNDNVAFVWHSVSNPLQTASDSNLSAWYPGDNYVDWCGISLFDNVYSCPDINGLPCNLKGVTDMVQFCKEKQLPIMIAESTPFGGIVDSPVQKPERQRRAKSNFRSEGSNDNLVSSEENSQVDSTDTNEAGFSGPTWERWFVHVLDMIERYDIRLWSYINCDWDNQPMWQKDHAPGQYWGDTRVQAYPGVRERWNREIFDSIRYNWSLHGSSDYSLFCEPFKSQTPNTNSSSVGTPVSLPTPAIENGDVRAVISIWVQVSSWTMLAIGWFAFFAIVGVFFIQNQSNEEGDRPPVVGGPQPTIEMAPLLTEQGGHAGYQAVSVQPKHPDHQHHLPTKQLTRRNSK